MITKCLVGNKANKFHEAIGGKYVKTINSIILGYTFTENIYYHDDIKKSLEINKDKQIMDDSIQTNDAKLYEKGGTKK